MLDLLKRGAMWTFVPPTKPALRAGADNLVDYQFNKRIIHHLFCRECGVGSYSRGQRPGGGEMIAINVRCLDAVDVDGLAPMPFDGKKL